MDDNFLQDEEPSFGRATLEIKREDNQYLNNPQNANDGRSATLHPLQVVKDEGGDSSSSSSKGFGAAAQRAGVPCIPYPRLDCHTFFSDRNEVVEKAIQDCRQDLLSSTEEDELVGTWMLTEISLWDTEKERLLLLTKSSLYSVKYDLISLKILEYNRVGLAELDTLVAGQLIYPPASLLPKISPSMWSNMALRAR